MSPRAFINWWVSAHTFLCCVCPRDKDRESFPPPGQGLVNHFVCPHGPLSYPPHLGPDTLTPIFNKHSKHESKAVPSHQPKNKAGGDLGCDRDVDLSVSSHRQRPNPQWRMGMGTFFGNDVVGLLLNKNYKHAVFSYFIQSYFPKTQNL